MKKLLPLIFTALISAALCACNCVDSAAPSASAEPQNVSANAGKRKIGIALYTLRTRTIAEIVELLKDMQVDAIGLSTTPLGGGFAGVYTTPDMTPAQKAYLKKLLADNGIKIASYGVRSPQTEAEIRKMLAFAKEMGIPLVLTESQGKALEIWNRVAPEYGVKVALHNHAYNENTYFYPRTVAWLMRKYPNIYGCPDNGHWERSGINTVDGYKIYDGRIAITHFKDIDKFDDLDGHAVALGTGKVDLKAALAELDRQKFDGYFMVEYEWNPEGNLEDVRKCVRFLKNN